MAVSAENILEQIRDEARVHEQARQMSHKEMVDIADKDERLSKRMADYQERQQGIENQLAKVQQHAQERSINIAKDSGNIQKIIAERDYDEKSKDGSGRATADGQSSLGVKLKEIGRTTGEQYKDWKVQIQEDAKRWNKNFQASLSEKAQFKQFQGALKTDFQLFQGKLQLLTSLPGMQTLLAAVKFAASRLLLWFLNTDLGKKIFGPFVDTFNKVKEEQEKTTEAIKNLSNPDNWEHGKPLTPKEAEAEVAMSGKETFKGKNQYGEYRTESSRVRDKEQYRDPKTGRYAPDPADMSLGDKLKKSYDNFKGGLTNLSGTLSKMWGKGMTALVKGFKIASRVFMAGLRGLTTAIATFSAALMTTITGFLVAAAPFILIGVAIALLVAAIVMFGMWLYNQKDVIMEKWEVFKEKFKAGWDKIVEVATFVKTWLSDKATGIKLKIKHMIAVVMDGIAAIVNGLIDGMKEKFPRLAKFFNVDQYKMEGGNVDAVAKQRADFEAMKQNRDMNAAGTAVRNAEGEIVTGAGGESTSNNIINTNSKNSTTLVTEKTTSSDSFANGQNASGF